MSGDAWPTTDSICAGCMCCDTYPIDGIVEATVGGYLQHTGQVGILASLNHHPLHAMWQAAAGMLNVKGPGQPASWWPHRHRCRHKTTLSVAGRHIKRLAPMDCFQKTPIIPDGVFCLPNTCSWHIQEGLACCTCRTEIYILLTNLT